MSDNPEALFGKRPDETPEGMFGPRPAEGPLSGEFWDNWFSSGSAGKLANDFGVGFKQGWGTNPIGRGSATEQSLKDIGILPDYDKGRAGVIREFNDYILRPAFTGIDLAMRTPYAIARGLAETRTPAALLGGAASAAFEGALGLEVGPQMAARGAGVRQLHAVERAANHGILEEKAPGMTPGETPVSEALNEKGDVAGGQVIAPATEEAPPLEPANDVHVAARQAAPEVFAEHDALQEQKANLTATIEELEAERTPDNTEYIDGVVGALRRDVGNVDARLYDLAPDVSDAYRAARDAMPTPPEIAPDLDLSEARHKYTQVEVRRNPGGGFDVETPLEGIQHAPTEEAAQRLVERYTRLDPEEAAQYDRLTGRNYADDWRNNAVNVEVAQQVKSPQTPPDIVNLLQRRPSIYQDVTRKLMDAGLPEEEARANAALYQYHYQALAARFNGALGSARDLYEARAPDIRAGGAMGRGRGSFNIPTNTITLFKDADASTFIHESMHGWLEEIQLDAKHPQAPPDLIADMQSLRNWVGAQGDEALTRAQNEKIVRGFERYLMEGHAPSARLASVFAKFRDWLTGIYQTVARLRAPINDEIRAVYDRLLNTPRSETIVAPEREVPLNVGELHERDLANATPENGLKVAENMTAERDLIAQKLRPEVMNARRRARFEAESGGAAEGAPGGAEVGGRGAERGEPVAVGSEPDTEPTAISPSGETAKVTSEPPTGPNEPFGPTDRRTTGADGGFHLDNIESPEDVDSAIRENTAQAVSGPIEAHQILDLADAIGIDPRQLNPDRLSQAFSAGDIKRLEQLLIAAEADVRNKMIEAAQSGNPLELAKSIARLEMIQGKAVQSAAEWNRSGVALRQFKEATGTNAAKALDQLLRRYSGRSYDELMQLAVQGQNLPTPRQVGQAVRNTRATMSPFGRQITWLLTNSYLSGLFTHLAYAYGNQLRVALQPLETGTSGLIGEIRTQLNLGPKERVYLQEVGASASAIGQGFMDSLKPAWESYKAGKQLPLPGDKNYTNPFNSFSPFGPVVTQTLGQPTKVVAGVHQIGRIQFYTQYLWDYTMRQALDEGLDGQALESRVAQLRQNPTDELMARARDAADTAMFQRRTGWNTLQSRLGSWVDSHAMAKAFFPFMKIGFEYARESIKRTPAAILLPGERGALLMREGGAAFDEAWGKVVFSTGLFAGGYTLASNLLTTGNGPSDPKKRSEWNLNHQPYSITIGNVSIPMKGLGYPSIALQFAADVREVTEYATKGELEELAKGYFKAVTRATLDEGGFRDLASLGEALSDPTRAGPRFIEGVIVGAVPYSSFLSQARSHIIDPYQKDIEPGLTRIFDDIRARMPITSWDVPNRVDMFGNDVPSRGINIPGFNVSDRYVNDPTVQWLNELQVGAGRLDRTVWGVRLTHDQYTDFAREAGQLTKEFLDMAYQSGLPDAPKGVQAKEINRLIGDARSLARKDIAARSSGTDNDIIEKSLELKEDALR